MAEPLCPMTPDGRHKIIVTQWGQVCVACHRTWQWRDGALVPTLGERRAVADG